MAGEEELRPRDVVGADAKDAAEAFHERPAAAIAEVVAEVRACGSAEEAEEDDEHDAVVASCRPGRSREQQGLAREWNTRTFDEDSQPGGGIAKRIHD